eukprot:2712972-Alexandrium_andersonii.AAC.1
MHTLASVAQHMAAITVTLKTARYGIPCPNPNPHANPCPKSNACPCADEYSYADQVCGRSDRIYQDHVAANMQSLPC